MPYIERTAQWSHRRPLLGAFDVEEALAAVEEKKDEKVSATAVAAPLISGAIMTAVSYSVARAMEIEKSKSWGLAATMGIVTAIGQIASGWLRGYAAKAVDPAAAAAAPVTATVVPAK